MAKMLRNTIRVKQDVESEDLRRYVRLMSPVCLFFVLMRNAASIVDSGSEPSCSLYLEHTTNSIRL
jgi:hypothetical protein